MLDRALELLVQGALRIVDRDPEPGLAQRRRELDPIRAVVGLARQDVHVGIHRLVHLHSLLLQREVQHVDPAGNPGALDVGTTHRLHQVAVPTASRDGDLSGLRELRVGEDELVHRPRVVVEPADLAVVDLIPDTEPFEPVGHRGKVRAVLVGDELEDLRRAFRDLAVVRVLAVEDP